MLLALPLCTLLFAQTVSTAVVEYNGLKYPAYVQTVDATPEVVNTALTEFFGTKGVKGKEHRGFTIFRNVPVGEGKEPVDVFVRVERDGKKAEEKSKVIKIVTRPGAISEDKPTKEARALGSNVVLAASGAMLFESMTPHVSKHSYLRDLTLQEFEIKRAEKKLTDLQSDKAKLEKQIEKLKAELETTNQAITDQTGEVSKLKSALDVKKATPPANLPGN